MTSAAASAQSAEGCDSRALMQSGVALRRAGNDTEAAETFRRAFECAPSPHAEAQWGLAEQALGHWIAAESHVRAALAHDSDPWIARQRAVLEGALAVAERHLGWLELSGVPASAEVRVNGVSIAAWDGRARRVEAGQAVIEVPAEGFLPFVRTVMVDAGGTARVSVALVPIPAAVIEPVAAAATSQPLVGTTAGLISTQPPAIPTEARSQSPRTSSPLLWVGGATFVVSGGVALVLAIIGEDALRRYDAECVDTIAPSTGCDARHASLESDLQTRALAVNGAIAIGALGLVVAIAGAVLGRRPPHRGASIESSGLVVRF